MEPAVFLDRDNTLIANDGDLGDPALVRLMEGVPEGVRALRDAGYRLIVVTNQGGVARGLYSEQDVDAVHQRIAALLDETTGLRGAIDRFYYCPFHPEAAVERYRGEHPWRKPGPGMLLQAAKDMDLDLAASWLVGDQERDIRAGRAAGCRTVLIRHADHVEHAASDAEARPTITASSFLEAVRRILDGHHAPEPPAAREREPETQAPRPRVREGGSSGAALRRAVQELTEELRHARQRHLELTPPMVVAIAGQALALVFATLAVLQLSVFDTFLRWMMGAVMMQLFALTLVAMDRRG